jgi:hypothetical protein
MQRAESIFIYTRAVGISRLVYVLDELVLLSGPWEFWGTIYFRNSLQAKLMNGRRELLNCFGQERKLREKKIVDVTKSAQNTLMNPRAAGQHS